MEINEIHEAAVIVCVITQVVRRIFLLLFRPSVILSSA